MTALTQEVAVKQMREQIRDIQQSIQSLTDVVQTHSKNAVEDRMLVNQMGELVNKLVLDREQVKVETPPTPRKTGNARQARK